MNQNPKTAVVTGAGSGIGKAVALIFLNAGYHVVLAGRNSGTLESAAAEAAAGQSYCIPADVGKPDDVEQLFHEARSKLGRLDILFNNAGISAPPVEIDELTVEQWQAVINTNLSGAFYCARMAYKLMREQNPKGGRIINNGSISATTPRPFSSPYTSTKHAISGLTKCLALDGRPHNIACGQIDIGNAGTDMAEPLGQGALQPNGETVGEPLMDVYHVATSVLHMAELPLNANVLFMNVMATKMPFVGRG